MWRAGPDLIVLLTSFADETVVLTDTYGNPCSVDRENLLTKAKERWQEQMNSWEHEFKELSKER
jgi:hypothetical protein